MKLKTLIIAEKESQALDYVKGLETYGSFKANKPGRFYESNKYIVTWAQGHIIGLMEPRDYENWGDRRWELEALPWYPPNHDFKHKVTNERIYNQIKSIFKRTDINEIIIATDAGREGTLIGQELIDHFGFRGNVKRYYDSAVTTPENIQKVIATDLKGDDFHRPRVNAAYARAYADLLLGMNFTIGFSAKAGATLSLGRVKTPIMAIMAARKNEILNFKEETYYELEVNFAGVYKGLWFKEQLSNTKFNKEENIQEIIAKIAGKEGIIVKKEVKRSPENPKMLYNLNNLQREASKKFGFEPNQTLEIVQSLYDTHKILSYPRTESEVIGTSHVKDLASILSAINTGDYSTFVQKIEENSFTINKKVVNDKKLSDHHAIIPTNIEPNISKLNENEKKIYDLVVKRFIAAYYPAAIYEKTEVVTEVDGETFKTSGRVEIDKGWKVIYNGEIDSDNKEEENTIPPIEKGESRAISETKKVAKKTTPPKLYDFDKLLEIMEKPKKFLETDDLKEALDSAEATAGLGTPATRGDILNELLEREYIIKKGKSLDVSDFGMKLVEVCPEKLKSPEITAEWEGKLRQMEQNEYEFDTFMKELYEYIESILDELRLAEWSVQFPRKGSGGEEVAICPHCGEPIKDIGKVYVCATSKPDAKCFIIPKEIGKKKISSSQIKELAENGETKLIKGFTAKSGTKFDAKLKLEGKEMTFNFEKDAITTCPYCKTSVTDRGKFYSCETHTRENACFLIFKELAKKTITPSVVKQLAEKGVTNEIKGFTGSKGKFDAKLKLDNKKISFAFNNQSKGKTVNKKLELECPLCKKGNIQENAKAFGCTNWQGGCKFTVWKNGDKINASVIETIIKNGESGRIDGLKSNKGSYYSVNIKIDFENKTINSEFIND